MKKALQILLLIVWALLGLALMSSLAYLLYTPYEDFTTTILQQVRKLDWRPYFQTQVLPPYRYALLPWLLGAGLLTWLLLSPWYYQKSQQWHRLLYWLGWQSLHQQRLFWRQCSRTELYTVGFVVSLAIIRMVYYAGRYALQYDEAWTYNHFISNGLLVSAVSPNNNHILYTLLACVSDWLPIEGQYSLRLPVMVGGVLLLLAFYKLARQVAPTNWAVLSLTFLAFAPAASLYSLYARGYIFQLLFTVLALSATWQLVTQQGKQAYHWRWWSLALVLGLYSVPTQIYVWGLLSGYLLWKGRRSRPFLSAWLYANAGVLLVTGLLYAPYFVTNGSRVLLEAAQASHSAFDWSYQDKVADWLLWGGGRGTPVYGYWLGLVGLLFFLYYSNKIKAAQHPLAVLVGLFLLLPTFVNILLGTQPPYRVWCFLGPFLALWIAVVGQAIKANWESKKGLLLAVIMIIGLYSWRLERHYALQWSAQLDWQVHALAHTLLENNLQSCYLFSNYDKPLLEYYYLRQGKRLEIHMASPASQHFAPFERQPLYEAVLWDSEDRQPTAQERAWLLEHYPIILYQDARVQLHVPPPAALGAPAN